MLIGPVAFLGMCRWMPLPGLPGHAAPAARPLNTMLGLLLVPALPNLNRYKHPSFPRGDSHAQDGTRIEGEMQKNGTLLGSWANRRKQQR